MGRKSVDRYDKDLLREMYRRMRLVREVERTLADLADADQTPGAVHLCIGQEAVAVGACLALHRDDIVAGTHRSHGHVLAKGTDVDEFIAELCGKENGLNRGRGGDMHLFDPANGVLETTGIIGANTPHVAGAVLASDLNGGDRVGISFVGDGAMNQGVVYETLNLASVWTLPMVLVCEDNQYAITTPKERAVAGDRLTDRVEGYDVPATSIDGQDVLAVYETVRAATERARKGDGPQFVHCETYRYTGHFSWEDDLLANRPYRTDEEVDRWKRERDPIRNFGGELVETSVFSEAELDAVGDEVEDTVADAVAFAAAGEDPDAARATEDVYAEQDYPEFPAGRYR